MARLKLFTFLLFLYCVSNTFVYSYIYSCSGSKIVASGVYAEKIKMARGLFTKSINFPEPKYYIKITQCYDAWADYRSTYKVILSESVARNFSIEELAGILGHELAHIQAHLRKEHPEHWQIDAVGAELTSKKAEISQLERMLKEYNNIFEKNKLLIYAFPLSYLSYTLIRNDFLFRIKRVDDHFKQLMP